MFFFLGGDGRTLDQRAEHVDLRQSGAEIIVQIVGDAGAFLLDLPAALGALSLQDLDLQLAGPFRDPPPEYGHPAKSRQRRQPETACHPQQPLQRPPRRQL